MSEPQPQHGSAPTPIPPTPQFPVTWDDPLSAQLLWQRDRLHFPEVTAPALDWFIDAHNVGFKYACGLYELPIETMELRRINGYGYSAVVPRLLPPDQMAAMGEKAERHLGAAIPRSSEHWASHPTLRA